MIKNIFPDSTIAALWKDSNSLLVIGANIEGNDGKTVVKRRKKEDGEKLYIPAPQLIKVRFHTGNPCSLAGLTLLLYVKYAIQILFMFNTSIIAELQCEYGRS